MKDTIETTARIRGIRIGKRFFGFVINKFKTELEAKEWQRKLNETSEQLIINYVKSQPLQESGK